MSDNKVVAIVKFNFFSESNIHLFFMTFTSGCEIPGGRIRIIGDF